MGNQEAIRTETYSTLNQPPVAEAGVVFSQQECVEVDCSVSLDGSNSYDPDSTLTTNDIVTYEWYEDGQLLATGVSPTVVMPLGSYDITLVVTDTYDATDSDIITVNVIPANLTLLDLDKAKVEWDKDRIKLYGKVALPLGVNYTEINPEGSATISVSSLGAVADESVMFSTSASQGKKWEYESRGSGFGITKYKIDWQGSKFDYLENGLKLKARYVGTNETILEIEHQSSTLPITIDINGISITFETDGTVTSNSSTLDMDIDDDSEVEVNLPFELTPDMMIDVGGSITGSILVSDYYTAAVGKLMIEAAFDTSGIDPSSLSPETLAFEATLGEFGFSGIYFVDTSDWKKLTVKEWKYRDRRNNSRTLSQSK